MPTLQIILGAILLCFGRRLYWGLVSIAGFLVGAELTADALVDQPDWVRLVVALAAGLLGAVLAVALQRLPFVLAGFLALGYVAAVSGEVMAPATPPMAWFLLGGIVGALIGAVLTEPTIIAFSSAMGSAAIVSQLQLAPTVATVVFVPLALFGAAVQYHLLVQDPSDQPTDGQQHVLELL